MALGVIFAAGLAAVPLWWDRGEPRASAAAPRRGPHSEVSILFEAAQVDDAGQCASDDVYERALYRLESIGPWPVPDSARSREVQLIAVGPIEIEFASMVMQGGSEAADVALPNRVVARKGLFAEPVVAPVVVLACTRARAPQKPSPTFRLTTWKEGGS